MKPHMKEILISHFDKDVSKSENIKDLESYGSEINNKYLRAPYEYVEKELLKGLQKKRVLDYCCGSGIYSILPAKNNANVFGIDFSNKSLDIAKKRAEFFEIDEMCQFSLGDAENLDFEDNYFDIILSYGSLSYLDLDKSFEELRRVLKPEGKVIVVDSLGHNPILNFNRKRNIKNYAPEYVDQLQTITHKDLRISLKYFDSYSIKYFDLFTLFGSLIENKLGYAIKPNSLMNLDRYILKIPLIRQLAFKFVCVIK